MAKMIRLKDGRKFTLAPFDLKAAFEAVRGQKITYGPKYSFCEPVTAGSLGRWHIRKLTAVGKKLGGGADTSALCGSTVSWDLQVDVPSRDALPVGICQRCWELYQEAENG